MIKLCYVNIGLLVTSGDLLYFSQHKSHEGQAKCARGSEGNREKDVREYEPEANEKTNYAKDFAIILLCFFGIMLMLSLIIKKILQ